MAPFAQNTDLYEPCSSSQPSSARKLSGKQSISRKPSRNLCSKTRGILAKASLPLGGTAVFLSQRFAFKKSGCVPWGHVPLSLWPFLASPGYSWLLLVPPGSSWVSMGPTGPGCCLTRSSRLLLGSPVLLVPCGSSCGHAGSSRVLSCPPGCSKPPGSSWFLLALAPSNSSWVLLDPPETSWALLGSSLALPRPSWQRPQDQSHRSINQSQLDFRQDSFA